MLKIIENEALGCTQLLNEEGYLVMQLDWSIYDKDWAYQVCLEKRNEVMKYRNEYGKYGYTKGVRRGQ